MRAFCTVSAPLEVCASSAEQLSPGSRFLALRLLGNQQPKTLYFLVDAKSRVREVYTQTCLHFAEQGMLDTELFGLAVLIDGEFMFADPESKLSKYGPKSWRSSHTHGLDANGRPLLELHFRVQFYIENPLMLKDETTRHYYYLQLKYNALNREIPKEFNEQSMILLAALALQADLGDAPLPAAGTTSSSSASSTTTTATAASTQTATLSAAAAAAATASLKSRKSNSSVATATSATATAAATIQPSGLSNKLAKVDNTTIHHHLHHHHHHGNDDDNQQLKSTTAATAASAAATPTSTSTTATTTLPKISKRLNNPNDRALRLSSYVGTTGYNNNGQGLEPSNISSIGGNSSGNGGAAKAASISAAMDASCASTSLSSSSASTSASGSTSSSSTCGSPSNAALVANSLQPDYFRLDEYMPTVLRTAWAESTLRAYHLDNRGISKADAQLRYIQQACSSHESLNAHTYRMRLSKNELGPGNSWFVVYAKGIKIFSAADGAQQHITFLWPNITKLSFERKKFEIRSGENKITLYALTDDKNKMLLTLCKETHQFSMKLAARLKEVIKREEEESNSLHACYIYSRSLHLPYKNKSDQRISVISSTSSNTTSGIVSDRVHSEDELEIMINSPPAPIAAPSTESLALAHLLDHPSVSRQTSSAGQVSRKDLEEQLAALSVRQAQKQALIKAGKDSPTELSNCLSIGNSSNSGSLPTTSATSPRNIDSSNATDSPSSQHNMGSQCSSTCSTVVVTSSLDVSTSVNVLTDLSGHAAEVPELPHRRNSTSSSLELGFSHTAQNSTLSEAESTCVPLDFRQATNLDETESVSGVYTLAHGVPPTETSGVYTMHSSEMTGQSSEIAESEKSSHYDLFQPPKSEISDDHLRVDAPNLDSVDGNVKFCNQQIKNEDFRLRSDSNISTSGSFRGDGSDPTDKKHTLLSAEELTDLIVGRGTYPNRKTVSSTLDSDCDYVTLPLPMEGDSYIQGHQDTAPSEDHVDDLISELLLTDLPVPPTPPQRVDSNRPSLTTLCNIPPPPPYHGRHEKTGLCGPPVRNSLPTKTKTLPMPIPIITPKSSSSSSSAAAAAAAAAGPAASSASALAATAVNVAPINKSQNVSKTSSSSISTSGNNSKASPKVPSKSAKLEAKPLPQKLPTCPKSILPKSVPPPPSTAALAAGNKSTIVSSASGTQATALATGTTAIRRRDPPPYPTSSKPRPTSLISVSSGTTASSSRAFQAALSSAGGSMTSLKSEEHTARFITTKPQINILKAHTSLLNETAKPSYAAPTNCSSAASSTGSVCSHQMSQHSVPNSNYAGGSQTSLSLNHHHHHHHHHPTLSAASAAVVTHAGVIPSTIGIPLVPYSLHSAHKSMSSLHQQPPPPPPYPEARTCVLLPVIKPRQFLPPPPPSLPRQPPPPPPPQLASIYTSPLAHKQLELYQQQLCSDVDYVIYPIQDPAVSQQEYLDAKQGSILAAMAQTPPPHPYLAYQAHPASWDTCKGHAIYRSTPYLPLALSTHSRYASTQNLSDTYVQLPSAYSSLYSPSMASLCSSYEPPPPPPLHPASLAVAAVNANVSMNPVNSSSNLFARSRSDDNILNTLDSLPKAKRLPPPPPPPYVDRRLKKPPMPTPSEKPPPIPSKPVTSLSSNSSSQSHFTSTPSLVKAPVSQLPPRKPPSLGINGRTSGTHMTKTSSGAQWIGERPKPSMGMGISRGSSSILAHLQASVDAANLQAAKAAAAVSSKSKSSANANSAATTLSISSSNSNSNGSASKLNNFNSSAMAAGSSPNSAATPNPLDIALLREKSKHLDLPLISALCNDRSLLKQTKVLVNPKNSRSTTNNHLTNGLGTSATPTTTTSTSSSSTTTAPTTTNNNQCLSSNANNSANSLSTTISNSLALNSPSNTSSNNANGNTNSNNYHTSGINSNTSSNATTTSNNMNLNGFVGVVTSEATTLSNNSLAYTATSNGLKSSAPSMAAAAAAAMFSSQTTLTTTTTTSSATATLGSKTRKSSLHRHPNDKLPPLPMQLAEANNYVMDPAILKHHKTFNS